jgi:amidase
MAELARHTARTLADKIRSRELSSLEVVDYFLARIERYNPQINAVVELDAERARANARQADVAVARGAALGPLHGVPMTIKDAFEVAGLHTTAGAQLWKDHVSSRDAVVVARLKAAGAIILGKTNTSAFCSDVQSFNALHGTTNNPWDPSRTPGGSSGGAAAALASGMTPIEFGSDVAGSIRTPSGFCGLYGHKPSYDLVPPLGHMPPGPGTLSPPDLSVVGPMARSADDLAYMLEIVAGPLPEVAIAQRLVLPPPRAASLRGYRVAAWLDDPGFPVAASVRSCLERVTEALRRAGVRVDDTHPEIELRGLYDLYRYLLDSVMMAGASPKIRATLEAARAGDPADPRTKFAQHALMRHSEWIACDEMRAHARVAFANLFQQYDVLLMPITMLPAFAHDHSEPQSWRKLVVNGVQRPYDDLFAWVAPATLTYLPATAAPAGRTAQGLPVGIQIVGPYLEDRTPIDFAGRLADLIGGFEPPPGY